MRGRGIIGTLLALMLVLTLLPVTAFARESTEKTPAAHAAPQEAVPVLLTGENETPATAAAEVDTEAALQEAVATGGNIRLTDDIAITSTLVIGNGKSVTLDLQGHVLQMTGSGGVIRVNADGQLTMEDSSSGASHKFDKSSALWTLAADDATGENIVEITGGVITGGSNSEFAGAGGIVIDKDGTFLMNGGNIVGCRDEKNAGGVRNIGTFTMNGGSIRGCVGTEYATGGIQNNNNAIMNANGGIVADCTSDNAFYGALLNDGHILVADDARSCTVFEGTARNNGIINGGIFNGAVMNSGGVIGNGTFNGPVTGSGTIKDGTFTATVTRSFFSKEGERVEITGLGTEALPYQIGTRAQLKLFRDIVNGIEGQTSPAPCTYGELTADIVLNDGTFDENGNYSTVLIGANPEEWTPIGEYKNDSDNTPYTGTFDGQGHAIKGLYVNSESDVYAGLFGCLEGAVIRNLTVDGYVQGCNSVGGITGKARANGSTPSTIENCRSNCRVVGKANISSFLCAGGIVGSAEDTTIAGCVNAGVVEVSGSNNYSSEAAGIVNRLYKNVTVKNCYNTGEIKITGDRLQWSIAGGIAGNNTFAGNTVSDCYNVGAVTVSYTGNEDDDYTAMVGGIMGDIYNLGNTVSNCYSVGTLTSTGTGTSYIGGVGGRNKNGAVENCYYLDSTTKKAIGNDDGTVDEATAPKTAAQFADGTVLALLINGRADSAHPWNSECQYLAASGRTLPVFKGQGDTHTHQSDKWATSETEHWKVCACGAVFDKAAHSGTDDGDCTTAMTCACGHTIAAAKDHTWGAWTSNDDGTHTRRCTISDCTKGTETANCSGGKATCSAKAQCAVCGAAYGPLDPNAHGSGLKHTPARAATTSHQGNIEYWHCANCGKFFSDAAATRVITLADTVIEKLRHSGVTRRYPAATGQPDASGTGKAIKSQDTGDAGVVLYAATALLSLTGAAWLTGKKRG